MTLSRVGNFRADRAMLFPGIRRSHLLKPSLAVICCVGVLRTTPSLLGGTHKFPDVAFDLPDASGVQIL